MSTCQGNAKIGLNSARFLRVIDRGLTTSPVWREIIQNFTLHKFRKEFRIMIFCKWPRCQKIEGSNETDTGGQTDGEFQEFTV
jgi:hypothetical protein